MTKIKIISNPYAKQIDYQIFDESENTWEDIAGNAEYSGKLKAEKLIHGFFPFVVKEIVDDIIDEYDDSRNKIKLFFEGTPDEYADLSAVCQESKTAEIIDLQPQERTLNNAYLILPKIVEIFDKNVRPIVESSISSDSNQKDTVESDLKKYSDASNDTIPICVIGNYSAGKSTFINALIGNEILPSGDKAVTARVYKIYQSKDNQTAEVIFLFDSRSVTVHFSSDNFTITGGVEDSQIINHLIDALSPYKADGYTVMMNKALAVLNDYVNSEKEDHIGSVIEIHIPFNKGLWGSFPGKYVILDTPGSNAASHADHRAVLTDAMKGMSNGIPVYVAQFDSLDSTDNESLYDIAKDMDGLDSRFTMIVVNKADNANLPQDGFSADQTDDILHESIPKNLYSSGIYFVSSIMGLGSKNNGKFIDAHGDETFDLYKDRFSDEVNRHYKQLYKYDIMPDQIKPAALQAADEEAGKDKIFANSGLYSIEHAIQTFSIKYASYNKCQQSALFLDKVIDTTKHELQDAAERREAIKKEMEDKLERDKQQMIENVESHANQAFISYESDYAAALKSVIKNSKSYFTADDLKRQEDYLTQERQKGLSIDDKKADARKQTADVGDAFKGGFKKLRQNFSLSTMKEVGASISKEAKEAIDSNSALANSTRQADREAARDLIQQTNHNFIIQAEKAEKDIDQEAKTYWEDCSVRFRQMLADVVKNSSLSEQKKNEITEKIVAYRKLEFDRVENGEIFKIDEFDYLLSLGNLKLFKMDKLYLGRLSNAYMERISGVVDQINENIYEAYLNSFSGWEENLVNVVRENIVDYSPELKEQQMQINEETERIHELQYRQNRLQIYAGDIHAMTDWKEA